MAMLLAARRMLAIVIVAGAVAVLLSAHEEGFPEQTLKMVFPEATGFTARTKTFTADQVKQIEQSSGSKLEEKDRMAAAQGKQAA